MNYFYNPGTLDSLQDLAREMRSFKSRASEYLLSIPAERFFAKPEKGWSIAENVKHLNKTTWPITLGLKLPAAVPAALFGKESGSRSFAEIREAYYANVQNGFQAPLIYRPGSAGTGDRAAQEKMVRTFEKTIEDLISAFLKLETVVIDSVRMPHPALGKLTIREMLFSCLNHGIHHLTILSRR